MQRPGPKPADPKPRVSKPGVDASDISTHEVWFVIWPGIQALDLAGPHEVFEAANRVADELGRGGVRYHLRVLSLGVNEIATESGLRIGCDRLEDLQGCAPNTLMLPGGDGAVDVILDVDLMARLGAVGRSADRLATVCTGTFLGAAAGLMDGKRVATHWGSARRLAARFSTLDVDAESLFVNDGNVWSSAGVTAGIDLALALVEQDLDAEVAQIAARWLVVHLRRPGGQSQFAAPVWSQPSPVEPIRRAQERVHANPGAEHTVAMLAAAVGLSPRHFTRVFTAEVGESPARFVDRVRVEAARRQLEERPDGVAAVAKQCGFGSAETMRRAFKRRLGVTPEHYRRSFRLSAEPIIENNQEHTYVT